MSEGGSSAWPAVGPPDRPSIRFIALAGLGFTFLYLLTCARSLQGGDSAEFLVIAARGGVAHPPGYPLYTLLARLMVGLPPLEPILNLSIASVLFALGAIVTLYLALLRWGLSGTASAVAAGLLGVSPVFWRYAGVPEVFSLAALLAACLLLVCGRHGRPRGVIRALLIGLVLGLGLSNHHTIILLAPVVAAGLYWAVKEAGRGRLMLVPAAFLVALALGLTPYLTLLGHEPSSGWIWGGSLDLGGVFAHALRLDYGTFSLGVVDADPGPLENVGVYLLRLAPAFLALFPLGLWGALVAMRAMVRVGTRRAHGIEASALLLSFLLAGPVLLSLFNLRPVGVAASVVERFYVLPDLMFAVLCAVGLEHLLRGRHRYDLHARGLAVGLACVMVVFHIDKATWADDYAVEDYIFNALDTTEPRSVIVGSGDMQLFGFLAASEVFAYRTDVQYIDFDLLRYRWYHQRVTQRVVGFEVPFDPQRTAVLDVVADLLEEHPVYLTELRIPAPALEARLAPIGPLLAVIPPAEPMPQVVQVEQVNLSILERMQFRGALPHDSTTWGWLATHYYMRTWQMLARAYERANLPEKARQMLFMSQSFRRPEETFRP